MGCKGSELKFGRAVSSDRVNRYIERGLCCSQGGHRTPKEGEFGHGTVWSWRSLEHLPAVQALGREEAIGKGR